jgi:hypothetical protein
MGQKVIMVDQELVDIINNHVHYLVKRPGMYAQDTSLKSIATHLGGYFQAIMETKGVLLPNAWHYWVSMKYGIWGPAWSWESTILENVQSEEAAIKILPELMKDFLSELILVGTDGIENAHRDYKFEHRS